MLRLCWFTVQNMRHAVSKTGVHKFRQPLCLITLDDRLQIVLLAVQCYWVMEAQAKQLPAEMLPMGFTEKTRFSQIQFFDTLYKKELPFQMRPGPTAIAI